jgi:hypothetical protein
MLNLFTLRPGQVIKHDGIWYGRIPTENKEMFMFCNLEAHTVIEHDNKSISVEPSILVTEWNGLRWHGYLRNGVWERLPDSNV